METKKYIYAAVGAPVAVAKSTQARVDRMRSKLEENAKSLGEDTQKRLDDWAETGESTVGKLTDTKTIDELTTRVDFDQMQSQVNKLRDQLEDLVVTWRSNFRPATEAEASTKSEDEKAEKAEKPAAKKPAAKKPAAKKPAAKKATTTKTQSKKPATKKAS